MARPITPQRRARIRKMHDLYKKDFSLKEIARVMGCTETQVYNGIKRFIKLDIK